ncbi:MAG: phenylalanine--tRNA ligase subunit beta, partial [Flavobacteriaceae bacterium]|nr:phenylalanine--tRNA ligase subunit beta [Flavobacteriaceae bacterium]
TTEPVQIICGAPNVAVGQKVPVATIGTSLYDKEGNEFKIKKGKIRGEESHGMICAEDELGLGDSHDGIMVLDSTAETGRPVAEFFNVTTDEVFEIGLTPNRADAMSHFGVARDLKAGLLQQEIDLELITPSVSNFDVAIRSRKIDVEVEDHNLVPRYAGVTITDVKVADSPQWLHDRLKAIGLTPINNVVDVTNYVLHELGQPLHAFDAAKINGDKILVKNLPTGTKFTTLDEIERELHEEDIMICDGKSIPMCIGGVFGGIASGVTETTTSIFLEAAYFDPVSIRKTAKRHGLNTDASFRFERGVDPNITEYALKRAALLIEDLTGGKIASDVVDVYPIKIEDHQVHLSYKNTFRLIGEEIPKDAIKNILASLDIKINYQTDSGLGLTIPAYRVEVTREADIVEEILRVYGYNNIATSPKMNTSVSYSEKINADKLQNLISDQLVSLGFNEMMANSLTKPEYVELSEQLKSEYNVQMLNPLSADLAVMRQSLLFSGLEAVAYNLNRKSTNLKFFEFGTSYHNYEKGYEENKHLTLTITGDRTKDSWSVVGRKSDFFYLKGVVVSLINRLGINGVKSAPIISDVFSEGLIFKQGKIPLVEFGIVRRTVLKNFGIKQEILYADFNWRNIVASVGNKSLKVKDLPKFPMVRRDLALLVNASVSFKELYGTALQTEKQLLKDIDLFDVYEGENLPEGKKSYALSFLLQDDNKTLNDKQIDTVMQKLQRSFEQNFNAELR